MAARLLLLLALALLRSAGAGGTDGDEPVSQTPIVRGGDLALLTALRRVLRRRCGTAPSLSRRAKPPRSSPRSSTSTVSPSPSSPTSSAAPLSDPCPLLLARGHAGGRPRPPGRARADEPAHPCGYDLRRLRGSGFPRPRQAAEAAAERRAAAGQVVRGHGCAGDGVQRRQGGAGGRGGEALRLGRVQRQAGPGRPNAQHPGRPWLRAGTKPPPSPQTFCATASLLT